MALRDLPAGQELRCRIVAIKKPANRTVRAIIDIVESRSANAGHANDLVAAIAEDSSLVTVDVQKKLKNLLESGCIPDLILPRPESQYARCACFGV